MQSDWLTSSRAMFLTNHAFLDGMSSITIIPLLDCFTDNKMTKLSKKLEKCPILGSFCSKYKQKCSFWEN